VFEGHIFAYNGKGKNIISQGGRDVMVFGPIYRTLTVVGYLQGLLAGLVAKCEKDR
jgi:hypothetical protein